MKKSHKHTELSSKVCCVRGCSKHLKKRLTEAKLPKHITRCYIHGRRHQLKHQHDKFLINK